MMTGKSKVLHGSRVRLKRRQLSYSSKFFQSKSKLQSVKKILRRRIAYDTYSVEQNSTKLKSPCFENIQNYSEKLKEPFKYFYLT